MFVSLAVENTNYSFDMPFTYEVPEELVAITSIGKRVTVPFGNGNKTRVAIVLSECEYDGSGKVKRIVSVLDDRPVLSKEMIDLVFWMKSRYFCTLFDCVKLMLPAGISYKVKQVYTALKNDTQDLSEIQKSIVKLLNRNKNGFSSEELKQFYSFADISADIDFLLQNKYIITVDTAKRKIGDAGEKMVVAKESFNQKLTPKQQNVYDALLETGQVSVKELLYFTGSTIGIVKALHSKGAVDIFEVEVYRKPENLVRESNNLSKSDITLSFDQNSVFQSLVREYINGTKLVSLLHGVTGSGKTLVFLKLIDYVIKTGKQVILMVPEISLTPQTIDLFKEKFHDRIAVFHSKLSLGERLDEWKRADRGDCDIVIGTRSAVFAPLRKLGLIVIDEEQETSYKSETTPRYNAKEVARFRCLKENAFCVLSSATPSIESYYMAKCGKFGFHKLNYRFGKAQLPTVDLVDMNEEEVFSNKTDFSEVLKNELNENFINGKQSIILLNRRGYHTFARCKECKEVISCPNCSISLTLHSANDRLMCHYCGYSVASNAICPTCECAEIVFSGYGTQRAEESLQSVVPDAKILRIDADSTSAKYSLQKKFDSFAQGEFDIMVGTQMVAKGLNFPNVTLVGVLSVDQSLCNDDFRSSEKTFDLLTQVVGRSGRGESKGKAVIQTYIPENSYLKLASTQDYDSFYDMEIEYRKAMLYPPFVDLLLIVAVGENEQKVKQATELFLEKLSYEAEKQTEKLPLRILRPSPAAVTKAFGKFRYKMLIKCRNTAKTRELISKLLIDFAKNKEFFDITVYADSNPYTII